ncbi:MAG: adenylate/guanylate cyclase domain-containing protein [Syntrophorhabdaceae bacterium]|nr:adenylate/guanylate cyclase domain-containing protein [Syntrophorhabdaceae bacterium]
MRKTLIPLLIGIAITLLFSFLALIKFVPFERLELLIYDVRYHLHGANPTLKDVVIAGIDDRSIEKLGRWPWDRGKIALIIDRLKEMGAKVIAVDIIFSEPWRDDDLLVQSMKRAKNVIVPVVFDFKGEKAKINDETLYNNSFPMIKSSDNFNIFPPISANKILTPLKKFSLSAESMGHINMIPDKDGVLRWEILGIEFDGEIFPAMTLQAVRMFLGLPMEGMILRAAEGVELGDLFIPTDFWHRMLIRYYGPSGTTKTISVLDIMDKGFDPSNIKDKIVLIGATAVGIYDLRVTPVGIMPGVEKHANVISSILRRDFVFKITNLTNILIVFVTGLFFTAIIIRVRAVLGAVISVVFVAALYWVTNYFFFEKNLWIDLSYSGSNILIIYFALTSYRYATEERYAKRIRGMFSSYVTEKVVNELIKNPNLAKLGGERREITVMFSDVRGFTTFSERHEPEQVVTILNEYLGEMTHIIFEWDGTLDKFVGDEIVAFWGAPIPQENHAELAVLCTLHMAKRLSELHTKWISEGKDPLRAGFGLNTGEVIVGNIGAEGKKMDYTVIGDNVNLGARVEGLTRKYDADIIITESTLNALRKPISEGRLKGIKFEGLDMVAVKGKAKPVAIYKVEPIGDGEECIIVECEVKDVRTMTEK